MKFKVTDKSGKRFIACKDSPLFYEEVPSKKIDDAEETKEETVLTEEEIKNLKELAKIAPELLELSKTQKKEPEADEEVEEEGFEEEFLKENEEVVNFDEKMEEEDVIEDNVDDTIVHDSKRSFGSIEQKKVINDDFNAKSDLIAETWYNKYNEIRKKAK